MVSTVSREAKEEEEVLMEIHQSWQCSTVAEHRAFKKFKKYKFWHSECGCCDVHTCIYFLRANIDDTVVEE